MAKKIKAQKVKMQAIYACQCSEQKKKVPLPVKGSVRCDSCGRWMKYLQLKEMRKAA
jgi:hypothetical protein